MNPDKDTPLAQETPVDLEAVRETRRLKHWLIKGVFSLLSVIVVTVVIGIMYDFTFREGDLNETMIGSLFTGTLKVFEVMISTM